MPQKSGRPTRRLVMMDLPRYPESRPIELGDKGLFDSLFLRLPPRISEFTFANLYLFRHAHSYRITSVEGALVVLGAGYGGETYFLPPLADDPQPAFMHLLRQGMTLYGADALFRISYLEDESLHVVEDRDNFDYLYLREELAELSGSRFHKKKNRLNYLVRRHEVRTEALEERHLDAALAVLAEWERVRVQGGGGSAVREVAAAKEALLLRRELGLSGIAAVVDGSVAGFSLGERLNDDTAVCHFEKADLFFEGLPQYLNREFSRLLFADCRFINREQDLGEPGLREAKLSYQPVELVRKFRAGLHRPS